MHYIHITPSSSFLTFPSYFFVSMPPLLSSFFTRFPSFLLPHTPSSPTLSPFPFFLTFLLHPLSLLLLSPFPPFSLIPSLPFSLSPFVSSSYILPPAPPFFTSTLLQTSELPPLRSVVGASVLLNLGDSVTTDHISPAGSISRNSPAARYLAARGWAPSRVMITWGGEGVSRRGWSPLKNGPPGPNITAIHSSPPFPPPPCRGWSHPWHGI